MARTAAANDNLREFMFLPHADPRLRTAGTAGGKLEEFRSARQYVSAAMRRLHARGMARGRAGVYAGPGQSGDRSDMDKEQTSVAATGPRPKRRRFAILLAVSFCHLLNDMMQALLPAIYPTLKAEYHLTFAQIGLITLAFQLTASLLQPAVGPFRRQRPMPYSLAGGMVFTLCRASDSVGRRELRRDPARGGHRGAGLVGVPSRIVARGAHGLGRPARPRAGDVSGGRQYRIGAGPAHRRVHRARLRPESIAWYSLLALLAIFVLWNVGAWYKTHGLQRLKSAAHHLAAQPRLPQRKIVILARDPAALIFSKFFYLSSITSYYTFYLIHAVPPSVQTRSSYCSCFSRPLRSERWPAGRSAIISAANM
jgi:FSR family fosmidomycin resistance protein-like MFS transporter